MEHRKSAMELADKFIMDYKDTLDNTYEELKKRSSTYLSLSYNIEGFTDDLNILGEEKISEMVKRDLKKKMQIEMLSLEIKK